MFTVSGLSVDLLDLSHTKYDLSLGAPSTGSRKETMSSGPNIQSIGKKESIIYNGSVAFHLIALVKSAQMV